MEITALRLIRNILGGWLCLVAVPQALALPIVESRTGDPVVRAPQSHDLNSSSNTASNRSYDSTYSGPQQIESLKEELNLLRGSMEEKQHALETQIQALKKSQQDFYVDLDKRLSQLERSKASGATKATAQAVPIPAVVVPAATATAVLPQSQDEALEKLAETEDTTNLEKPASHKALTEKACYEEASAHLSAHRYAEAIKGFGDCVARYPQGTYAAQCYYWLGESYMAQWGSHKDDKTLLDKASQAFLMVTTRFPTHQRATDALLKLGMVEQEKGNLDVSKRYFEQVRDRYPDSAAARMAEAYLQED